MSEIKVVVVDNRTTKEKIRDTYEEVRDKAKVKTKEACYFVKENWQTILAVSAAAIPVATGAVKLVKSLKGSAAERHEDRMKNCYYDPSTGLHWDLKRMLNNSERIELMQRKRNGEFTEDILRDMRLLKK